MTYILIVIFTFTHASGIATSTVQVGNLSKPACEEMLKKLVTSSTGINSQVRLADCYASR